FLGDSRQSRLQDLVDESVISADKFLVLTVEDYDGVAGEQLVGKGFLEDGFALPAWSLCGKKAEFSIVGNFLPRGGRRVYDHGDDEPACQKDRPSSCNDFAEERKHGAFSRAWKCTCN